MSSSTTPNTTQERIVDVADWLFYQGGYEHTSITDIAGEAGIARGNLTFHFKTKDDLLTAVIQRRLQRTQSMLDHWESDGETAEKRIKSFINILLMNRTKILLHGCPVGTLCTELAKLEHASLSHANELFTLFRRWLKRQFELLGSGRKADAQAMQVLAWSQGVATLANAFSDEKFIRAEVRRLHDWLDSLQPHPAISTTACTQA